MHDGKIDLTGKVAIVTGAGVGLGKAHALALAARGATLCVNDLGEEAENVAEAIRAAGGQAMSAIGSVTDIGFVEQMADDVRRHHGGVDILVNNAGILRDKSFANMSLEDFRLVMEVHVMGSVHCTRAVWNSMRERGYGRIVLTTSSSGLWGNFGQSNYGAAKMALVGFMQSLGIEGAKYDIRVNCLAPTAATRMMEDILPEDQLAELRCEQVSSAVLALVAENAPNRAILCAGAGSFELALIGMTQGIHIADVSDAAEDILERWPELADQVSAILPSQGFEQSRHELAKGGFAFEPST